MGKIFFIGNIVNQEVCEKLESCSIAGNMWQYNFYNSLKNCAVEKIINISIVPLKVFPFGKILSPNKLKIDSTKQNKILKYLNIIFIKKISIFLSLLYYFIFNMKSKDKVILYNLYSPVVFAVFLLKIFFKIEIVAIIADIVVENDLKYKGLKKIIFKLSAIFQKIIIKKLDYVIAVNELILKDFKIKNGNVLEGGINLEIENNNIKKIKNNVKKIVFTGTLDNLNGLEFLLKSFLKTQNLDLELCIYGRGPLKEVVKNFSLKDSRIKYCGFIKQNAIKEVLMNADLLIIPRLKSIKTLRYTFPSKLFEYMESGTPILMTNIPGLNDEYKKEVFIIDTEEEEIFSKEIEQVLSLDDTLLEKKGKEAKEFILKEKNWDIQVKKIYLKWCSK